MPSWKQLLKKLGLVVRIIENYSPSWDGEKRERMTYKFIEDRLKEIETEAKNLEAPELKHLYQISRAYLTQRDFCPSLDSDPIFGGLIKEFLQTLETEYKNKNHQV